MKQRHHRKTVQRRMREAPTQYDRDCAFYEGHRWKKRDSKKILRRPLKPLEFNRIHMIGPDMLTHRTIQPFGNTGKVITMEYSGPREPPVFADPDDAMLYALTHGEGWARVGRGEFMRDLTADALYKAMTK